MKERIITASIILLIFVSSFYFGFHRLTDFSGVDEHYWSYDRVPGFWGAVAGMKWKKTNISDKPGVPLAIISGAGLPFIGENPHNYKELRYAPKTEEQVSQIRKAHFWLRLPVFLFTLLVLPLFYFLVKKLLGKNTARFAVIFIGLSPVLLGISLIINSDAILWILTALSTLSLFVYLGGNEKKYLFLSGFLLGLSVITKYVANILFVYFFLVFFLEYVFWARGKIPIAKYLKRSLFAYLIIFATAMATAFVFFPATWIKIPLLIKATIGNKVFSSIWPLFFGVIALAAADTFFFRAKFSEIVLGFFAKRKKALAMSAGALFLFFSALVFLHVWGHVRIFDLQDIVASPKGIGSGGVLRRYTGAVAADFYSLLFSISPLVLFLLLFAVARLFRKGEMRRDAVTAVYIIVFIFIFYLGSAVNSVVTMVRYQIMVYPLVFILAASGMARFMEIEKVKKYVPQATIYIATAVILLASLVLVRPHYLAYASEILPKSFIVNLKGMGEGSFEAATFLNSLPDAKNLTIWSDKGAVCEVFAGKCLIGFDKSMLEGGEKIDYFVVSTDRQSRTFKMSKSRQDKVNFKKAYASDDYVFRTIINRNPRDYVKVLRADDILIK